MLNFAAEQTGSGAVTVANGRFVEEDVCVSYLSSLTSFLHHSFKSIRAKKQMEIGVMVIKYVQRRHYCPLSLFARTHTNSKQQG